ncbi:MAG: PDDEXK nuclease domain-containing protein [Bacteroidia bacterium]
MNTKAYTQTIKQLKSAILASRYKAASLANRELLALYFNVGKLIDTKSKQGKWGDKILVQLSNDLQSELPGLKGFSATNIKRMRTFYIAWNAFFVISPTVSDQLQKSTVKKQVTGKATLSRLSNDSISPTLSDQFIKNFFAVSFSHHYELLIKTKTLDERQFYIIKTATEFWSLDALKHHLKSKLFKRKGTLPNNFDIAITNEKLRNKALQSFKDEYLLDFINIEDPDDEDERVIENEIVRNIKKFLMSLGTDFAFIANQYRVIVDDEEYFADLLFFNRKLQCLVAFDLKKGKFKPEYAGKMNFYLSALDEFIKQPHELPSIGIILCKEKNNKTVEFSFRDMSKPMGVATYKTSAQLPKQFKNALPDAATLKKLMG